MVKIILRLNLSDFINKPYEKEVINKLEEIHKDSVTYYLTLWYEDGSIVAEDLKRFLIDYEKRLHFKTTIKVGSKLKKNDFIWYDIINRKDIDLSDRIRFQYTYSSEEYILKGLDEFHKCAVFCTSEKPAKKQKRNDYESSNSRK
jgi:hypothetical protein|tara:strand:+ start:544 stop:978 length:435 start_codon:yes stop_codon:yes gene_type:complete